MISGASTGRSQRGREVGRKELEASDQTGKQRTVIEENQMGEQRGKRKKGKRIQN